MYLPKLYTENLFDEFFDDIPRFVNWNEPERKLYGRHADRLMKTDVRENGDAYEIAIDLPGFKKEEIALELENGYLTISATKSHEEKKEEKGKLIRQERYSGAMQRSFFVGETLTEEDIKASFRDGVLELTVPKAEAKKLPDKKTILIGD